MTTPDQFEEEAEFSHTRYWLHLIGWSVLVTIPLITAILVWVGFTNLLEGGDTSDILYVAIGTPIAAITGYLCWRWAPDFTMGEPNTARGNRIRWLLVAVVAVGMATAFPIILSDNEQRATDILFSNGPMPFWPAITAITIWAIAMPFLILFGRRNSDEHGRAAGDFGMMVGFQVFGYAAPIWWMGWRAEVFPQPDVMILFIVTGIVSSVATLWKRSS